MGRKRLLQKGVLLLLVFLLVAPLLEVFHFHGDADSQSPKTNSVVIAETVFEKQTSETLSSFNEEALKKKSPLVAHEEDCHCPLHRTNCGHTTTYLIRDSYSFDSLHPIEIVLVVRSDLFHQGPFLEGPFQPPRLV